MRGQEEGPRGDDRKRVLGERIGGGVLGERIGWGVLGEMIGGGSWWRW